ncbi:hypothetical protein BDW62DRAFT_220917 [Aspergillus aurantiobrunneus]
MEHLPLPSGVSPFIVAPYEAPNKYWYGNEGFLSFSASRNWTEAQLRDGFKAKAKTENVEQFFQTWLFFGLVIDVLKVGGVVACTEDFLKNQGATKARIVDTNKLPEMLVDWENGMKEGRDLHRDWQTLNEMFDRAGTVLDRFCKVSGEDVSPLERPRPWPVRDEISTTMIALASTLRRAAITYAAAKWCVADVTTALKQLPIDGHYYLAGSEGLDPAELDHHARCVREHCLYDYDLDMYVTRHVTEDHCRESIDYGGQLGPERGQTDWVIAISRIICKGAVPIALWNKGMRKLWSVEYHFSGKRKPDYVAISHVWADGKGNPKANSLPECQLDRIQRLVEKVIWEGRKEVPLNPNHSDGVGFWMDTLCIPVEDEDLNDKAIAAMRHVYSHAKVVLVLDDWLKRLWTHQEGFLPKAVWFQFADRSARGIHLSFPINANLRLVNLYTFLTFAFKSTNEKKWILYKPLAAAMSERKTSRLADEIICLATIVDIPLQPFLEIPPKPDEKSGPERMARFLLELGRFDTGIVFNNYERLEKRGYSWAPRPLLNLRTAQISYWGSDVHSETDSPFEPVNGKLRLLVRYPGFLVNFAHGKPSFAAVERGCAIKCTGSEDTVLDIKGKWFIVQIPPNEVEWTTWKTYAVILSEIPKGKGRSPAVVASVDSRPPNGVYTVEHEFIASVWLQDSPPAWVDTIEAQILARNTQWLIT